jgi:hypothetical protein
MLIALLLALLAAAALIALLVAGGHYFWTGVRERRGNRARCRRCGFDLAGHKQTPAACPECGRALRVAGAVVLGERHVNARRVAAGLAMIALGVAPFIVAWRMDLAAPAIAAVVAPALPQPVEADTDEADTERDRIAVDWRNPASLMSPQARTEAVAQGPITIPAEPALVIPTLPRGESAPPALYRIPSAPVAHDVNRAVSRLAGASVTSKSAWSTAMTGGQGPMPPSFEINFGPVPVPTAASLPQRLAYHRMNAYAPLQFRLMTPMARQRLFYGGLPVPLSGAAAPASPVNTAPVSTQVRPARVDG